MAMVRLYRSLVTFLSEELSSCRTKVTKNYNYLTGPEGVDDRTLLYRSY